MCDIFFLHAYCVRYRTTFLFIRHDFSFSFDDMRENSSFKCAYENYGKSKSGNNRKLKTQMVAAAVGRGRSKVGMFVLVVVQIASGLVQI